MRPPSEKESRKKLFASLLAAFAWLDCLEPLSPPKQGENACTVMCLRGRGYRGKGGGGGSALKSGFLMLLVSIFFFNARLRSLSLKRGERSVEKQKILGLCV